MTLTNSYATLAQFRTHMGDTGTTLNTELAERAINSSSRAIDQHCGRRFWLDGSVTHHYYIPEDPYVAWVDDIGTTTGLLIYTDTTGAGAWATTWASTDYQLEPVNADQGPDTTAYSWTRIAAIDRYTFITGARRKTLKVTAKHGFSAVPVDVEEACLLKAAAVYERRKSPTGMVSGVSEFGAVRIGGADRDVRDLLYPYVRLRVGAI